MFFIFEKLIELVVHGEIPILGICVGMQSFFNNSEEGNLGGLGFINSNCRKFANNNKKMDTNFFGIPKEPIGISNDATGFMGPPKYKNAKFKVFTTIKIP